MDKKKVLYQRLYCNNNTTINVSRWRFWDFPSLYHIFIYEITLCVCFQPYDVVQTCVPVTLKGDETNVYRVTLIALVSTTAVWPPLYLDTGQLEMCSHTHFDNHWQSKQRCHVYCTWATLTKEWTIYDLNLIIKGGIHYVLDKDLIWFCGTVIVIAYKLCWSYITQHQSYLKYMRVNG